MFPLDRVRKQVFETLNSTHQQMEHTVTNAFNAVSALLDVESDNVRFPEENPCTVATDCGQVRLEPIAFATFRYCWYVYLYEGRDEIPFMEIGEKIYQDSCAAKSTIHNAVKRGQLVNNIGITYYSRGEYVVLNI